MEIHWIVLLCSILPLWLLQNTIHKLAHSLTIYMGWKWKFSIYPFPSKRLDGRFTFAHVLYEMTEESKMPSKYGIALVSIMPKITNILFILKAQLWAVFFMEIPSISLIALLFSLFNFIDFAFGALQIFRSKLDNAIDIWDFQYNSEISIKTIRISVIFWTVYLLITNIAGSIYILSHI